MKEEKPKQKLSPDMSAAALATAMVAFLLKSGWEHAELAATVVPVSIAALAQISTWIRAKSGVLNSAQLQTLNNFNLSIARYQEILENEHADEETKLQAKKELNQMLLAKARIGHSELNKAK